MHYTSNMSVTTKKEAALELHHLTTTYGKQRGVRDISLRVEHGEVFGFLGPNGAGKSTTINTILDLLRPTSGSVAIFGQDVRHHGAKIRQRVGFLSGDMATDHRLTGKQYLMHAAALHGGGKDMDSLVDRLRCETGKKIQKLSRGNRQKIGLVAALMHDPDLLILDEPTTGLDPLIQSEFNEIIRERADRGKTTFLSSHVLSEVQAICDRIGFIRDGVLVQVSTLAELTAQAPRHIRVTFKNSAPVGLRQLSGVQNFQSHGSEYHFTYTGNYDALIRLLATVHVRDLQVLEPSLDELFLTYYSPSEEATHVS